MKNPLWKKYFSESWLLLLAIGIGLFAFGWFRVTVVCELDTGKFCLLYTSPSPRDRTRSRMPSSA